MTHPDSGSMHRYAFAEHRPDNQSERVASLDLCWCADKDIDRDVMVQAPVNGDRLADWWNGRWHDYEQIDITSFARRSTRVRSKEDDPFRSKLLHNVVNDPVDLFWRCHVASHAFSPAKSHRNPSRLLDVN